MQRIELQAVGKSEKNTSHYDSESDTCFSADEKYITSILPSKYDYTFTEIHNCNIQAHNFKCSFKIRLENEDDARKWVQEYNTGTQETMVFQRSKKRVGQRVCKKRYLRCHHRQRTTGNNKDLLTTHQTHSNKNCNCPAQLTLTILAPHKRHCGYLTEVMLQHNHNHTINVADALRFRPISEETKAQYYDLFKQGHSPSSAHLEYETNLMYTESPQLLADRNINPKTSDVYNLFNKWRKIIWDYELEKNYLQNLKNG